MLEDGLVRNAETTESCWSRWYSPKIVLVVFTLINFVTYFDRGAMSASIPSVRADPELVGKSGALSEAKGGLIVSMFMVGFMVACPIFTSLGHFASSKLLSLIGLSIWLTACCLTGFSKAFVLLVIVRMFVGVGEAAFAGFFVAIIDNIAPKKLRTIWIGIFYSMIPVGTAIGMGVGGILAEHSYVSFLPGWRFVFGVESVASVPVLLAVLFLPCKYDLHEKARKGQKEMLVVNAPAEAATNAAQVGEPNSSTDQSAEVIHSPPLFTGVEETIPVDCEDQFDAGVASPWEAIKHLLKNVDVVLLVAGNGTYVFVLGAMAVFAIPLLATGPWQMKRSTASMSVGAVLVGGGLIGSIFGGMAVDWLGGSKGYRGVFRSTLFSVCVIAAALPCMLGSFFIHMLGPLIALFGLSTILLFATTAPINASVLTVVDPRVRAHAISYSVLFIHLLGDFPSPVVAGAISDAFSRGCPSYDNKELCTAPEALAKSCEWVPPRKHENGHCVNMYSLRNAMAIVSAVMFMSLPTWAFVSLHAWYKSRRIVAID